MGLKIFVQLQATNSHSAAAAFHASIGGKNPVVPQTGARLKQLGMSALSAIGEQIPTDRTDLKSLLIISRATAVVRTAYQNHLEATS